MRVAVHFEDGSVAAYRHGRILDTHHPATGEPISRDEIAAALIKAAKKEYPKAEVVVERLHDNGDGTAEWVSEDFEGLVPLGAGAVSERSVEATQDQEASN